MNTKWIAVGRMFRGEREARDKKLCEFALGHLFGSRAPPQPTRYLPSNQLSPRRLTA
jgi:hypothetical protein